MSQRSAGGNDRPAQLSGADDEMDNDPTDASNAILDLIRMGKLDEAETAARYPQERYPEIHDDWDRLAMVHEARGERAQAIDCYRPAGS